jgi:hypothetical protein
VRSVSCEPLQELVRRARALLSKLRALYTSGYSGAVPQRSRNSGASVAVLNNPYRRSALAEAVRRVLEAPEAGVTTYQPTSSNHPSPPMSCFRAPIRKTRFQKDPSERAERSAVHRGSEPDQLAGGGSATGIQRSLNL